MKQDWIPHAAELLHGTRIFCDASPQLLTDTLMGRETERRAYEKGAVLLSPDSQEHRLGLLITGEAQVSKGSGAHRVLMSRLKSGDLFGAVTLYQACDYFVTRITALRPCTAVFLTRGAVAGMIRQEVSIAENYIAYLSDRIYFLNSRIDSFTGGSAESRLADYLLKECAGSPPRVALPMSMTRLSELLDIGRASLYRAMDVLAAGGAIEREGKRITVLDQETLRQYRRGIRS